MILNHLQFVSTLGPMKLHGFILVMLGAWSILWLFVCTYSNMCAQCKWISSNAPMTVHTYPNCHLVLTQFFCLYRNDPSELILITWVIKYSMLTATPMFLNMPAGQQGVTGTMQRNGAQHNLPKLCRLKCELYKLVRT